ncbi:Fur family transcriptional regulator [Ammoniphilus resinae]|uniref:Fur family peroxide stress response transcriptional regulator n=1 Tax=Ammoniphilus resinae TaxID=861532 RepID=A0ABS4GJ55_9BACL|nr:Fur family transcriptional regulator [Ammoniphilus resinae]MBP1930259.1 Fur family peroxide stress response transcriptional regulator [Ammoniphilus resinae]
MSMERVDLAIEKLRNNGVRLTPQRYAILSYLMGTTSHPTADEIYRELEDNFPNMSVATIYNNLKLFKEAGLVRELTFGDASSRFDGNTTDHYHCICVSCQRIVDFPYPPITGLEQEAQKTTGFLIDSHRLDFFGTCETCQQEKN